MTKTTRTYDSVLHVDATVERVTEALTTLGGIRGWWSPVVTGMPRPGREFHVGFEGLEETITLAVVDADASGVEWRVREHTSAPDWADSRITFRLTARGGGCRLALRHEGVPPERVAPGWEHFLDSLRGLVETGEGLPYPWSHGDALPVAMRYHTAWTSGRFDEAIDLLAEDLDTEVPINCYSSKAEWGQAVVGFGSIVDRAEMVSALGTADQAVLIYDMHTEPYGVLRVAEHFTVTDGTILRIRHVHDTVAFREPAATA